jgi:hypothetical protein
MRCGNHLREIVHGDGLIVIDHQVEFVEVTMDKSIVSQSDDEIHAVTVYGTWIGQLTNLATVMQPLAAQSAM